jgi:hypothetical protein
MQTDSERVESLAILLHLGAKERAHEYMWAIMTKLETDLQNKYTPNQTINDLQEADSDLLLKCIEYSEQLFLSSKDVIKEDNLSIPKLRYRLTSFKNSHVNIQGEILEKANAFRKHLETNTPNFSQVEKEAMERMKDRARSMVPIDRKISEAFYTNKQTQGRY